MHGTKASPHPLSSHPPTHPSPACSQKLDGPYDNRVLPVVVTCVLMTFLTVVWIGSIVRWARGSGVRCCGAGEPRLCGHAGPCCQLRWAARSATAASPRCTHCPLFCPPPRPPPPVLRGAATWKEASEGLVETCRTQHAACQQPTAPRLPFFPPLRCFFPFLLYLFPTLYCQ